MEAKTLADLTAKIASRASVADEAGALPSQDIEDLKRSGYAALTLPKAYGGAELSLRETLSAQLVLAKASGSTALVAAMTLHLVARERELNTWKASVREKLFNDVAKGALINSAASEPRLGSPSRGGLPDTFAELTDQGYLIHGHKNWVTGGEHLSHLLVRLRLGEEAVVLWVPSHIKGVRWEKTWGTGLSLRASDSHDVYFDNVCVPKNHFVYGKEASAPLIWFPMLVGATYLGVALAARDAVITYALERVPTALGKPIATLSKVQRQIGEIDIMLRTARSLLLQTASSWTGQEPLQTRAAFVPSVVSAKHVAVETALKVTDLAMRIAGAASIDKSLSLERYFRDVRAGLMHPPSGDAALELVGRSALKL